MLNLNNRQWSEFIIGDYFDIVRGNAKGIREKEDNNQVALISAIDNNNGFYKGTVKSRSEKSYKDVYTVNNNGNGVCLAYYHTYEFIASSDVTILLPKFEWLKDIDVAHFIITMIRKQKSKYNYGYKMSNPRMQRQSIMLPIGADGEPDYVFMKQFIYERKNKKRLEYIEYAKRKIEGLGGLKQSCQNLNEVEWKSFFIKDIFNLNIKRGKRLTHNNQIEGNTPYVSSSALNNGVDRFIGNTEGVRRYENCLSLANSGSVGSCFYEPFEFIASDHVTHLQNDNLSEGQYLFIATMLSRLSQKYNFNREINDTRISREKVYLPVDQYGMPNYEYMDQYSKNLLKSKYQEYVSVMSC